jgi:hypothetical protein
LPPFGRPPRRHQTSHLGLRLLFLSELARTLPAARACHAIRPHAVGRPIPHAAGSHAAGCSGRVASVSVGSGRAASVSVGSEESGARETKKLTKKLDCGLIHLIMEGFFAKCLTEDPNHGTLAYFIMR